MILLENIMKFIFKQNAIFYLILFIITLIDIKKKIIPDKFTFIIFSIALVTRVIVAIQGDYTTLVDGFLGLILGGLPFYIIAMTNDGGIGGGDIKLLAAIGMWVGTVKIIEISIGVMLVICLIIIVKVLLKNEKSTPLAPFIALITMLVV